MRQVVFNVGAGLCSYLEIDNKTILVDLGKSEDFNPVIDFLVPLFKRRNEASHIDFLIISHPHKDHISAIEEFEKYFSVGSLITPNDNYNVPVDERINWKLIGNENDPSIIALKRMLKSGYRVGPPIWNTPLPYINVVNLICLPLYNKPKEVEEAKELQNESYPNNISIMSYFNINGYKVLMPGDLQKAGMETLIKNNLTLRCCLSNGIDVLVAPHHGLNSGFSQELFELMKNRKTRCINIISEKPNTDDHRDVNTCYYSSGYCDGENCFPVIGESQYAVKTSRGHVFLDYSCSNSLNIEVIKEANDLIQKFLSLSCY